MGAALLLVRHLIWCGVSNKVFCRCAGRTSRYGSEGPDALRGGWVGTRRGAKTHGRTRPVRGVWGRAGYWGAGTPRKRLPGLSSLPPSHLAARPPLALRRYGRLTLAGVFALKVAYS